MGVGGGVGVGVSPNIPPHKQGCVDQICQEGLSKNARGVISGSGLGGHSSLLRRLLRDTSKNEEKRKWLPTGDRLRRVEEAIDRRISKGGIDDGNGQGGGRAEG